MKMSTQDMAKIGGAAMAVGAAAAVAAGIVNMRGSKTKRNMKKLAKKSIKAMDNIVDTVNSAMKRLSSLLKSSAIFFTISTWSNEPKKPE